MSTKRCYKCDTHKPVEEFAKNKSTRDGLMFECRVCNRNRAKAWAKANPDRVKKYHKQIVVENPCASSLGMGQAETYAKILAAQGGTCALCPNTTNPRGHRLDVDHDHDCCPGRLSCGQCIRGLLCRHHNMRLGIYLAGKRKVNPEFALQADAYLAGIGRALVDL